MCAAHGELLGAVEETNAAAAAGRTIQNAVVISQSRDLFAEVIFRKNGEAAVAQATIPGLAQTADRSLIHPLVWIVLILEDSRNATISLVCT